MSGCPDSCLHCEFSVYNAYRAARKAVLWRVRGIPALSNFWISQYPATSTHDTVVSTALSMEDEA